jgi:hypothetical protein
MEGNVAHKVELMHSVEGEENGLFVGSVGV